MYVKVRVKAGAKRERFLTVSENEFEIDVKEPAKQNMANKRVTVLLASYFKTKIGNTRLITGHHSPVKMFSISNELQ